jgi:hypothetical protein
MDNSNNEHNIDQNRRDFVKKAAYTTPAIVTMAALPSFASAGSANAHKLVGNRPPPGGAPKD